MCDRGQYATSQSSMRRHQALLCLYSSKNTLSRRRMSQKVKTAADCCMASTNKSYIQLAISLAVLRGWCSPVSSIRASLSSTKPDTELNTWLKEKQLLYSTSFSSFNRLLMTGVFDSKIHIYIRPLNCRIDGDNWEGVWTRRRPEREGNQSMYGKYQGQTSYSHPKWIRLKVIL